MDEASSIRTYSPDDIELGDDHLWNRRRIVTRTSWTYPPAWGRSASFDDSMVHAIRWYYVARHPHRSRPDETLTVWYCGRRSVVSLRIRRPKGVCPDCVAAIVRSRR